MISPLDIGAGARVPQRPSFEVADIFRRFGALYREQRRPSAEQRRVMRAIETCRTEALGGHLERCTKCEYSRPAYNSCRNRHCPKCQSLEQARWIAARKARVLPVRHYHVVFTLPTELRALARVNRSAIFDMLFESAAHTLLAFAADEKWLGAQPAISAVLHTWARNLEFHPHVHCVVTDGGLTRDGKAWRHGKGKGAFLFPVRALSMVFRAKFMAALTRAWRSGRLDLVGPAAPLSAPAAFAALKNALFAKPWVVYAKAPFRGADHVFEYLGRYTHRVAISNHRLVRMDRDRVVFRTRGAKQIHLQALEFIRRFLFHVLPSGFVRIRHYGLYASGAVKTRLARAHALLGSAVHPEAAPGPDDEDASALLLRLTGLDVHRCPKCGVGRMETHDLPRPPDISKYDPSPPPKLASVSP